MTGGKLLRGEQDIDVGDMDILYSLRIVFKEFKVNKNINLDQNLLMSDRIKRTDHKYLAVKQYYRFKQSIVR